jgi:hypothetical protein
METPSWHSSGTRRRWDETTFGRFYTTRADDGSVVTYSRKFFEGRNGANFSTFRSRRDALVARYGLTPASRVLVGGAALGFLVEQFHLAGYPNVWGLDDSPLISGPGQGDIADGVILIDDRVQPGGAIRAKLRNITGDDEFDLVVTEDMLTCLTDAEILSEQVLFGCDATTAPGGAVCHIVTVKTSDAQPIKHPDLNWKTLAEWRAWLDAEGYTAHEVADAACGEFL